MLASLKSRLTQETSIAPLAVFRMVFGAILFVSIIRFMLNGWVDDLYVSPQYYFTYYGFEWVKPLGQTGMYLLFSTLALAFLFQAFGFLYRWASAYAFLAFTYVELIDKTNYLNHYYFVSIICLLLIFAPAHRYFSVDVWRKPSIKRTHLPYWVIFIFQLQLGLVYFFAGLAKLNYEWLFEALPLKIWLPAKSHLPLIGSFLKEEWVAYLFSWFGALYDLSIPFLLIFSRTRWFAYFLVIVFHLATYLLFQIGMFPFIMIGATLIFFSPEFHQKIIHQISKVFHLKSAKTDRKTLTFYPKTKNFIAFGLTIYFFVQITFPFRYLAYPGKLYWTEEGYRFSWRVMLIEKAGYAIFHITDPESGRSWEANNYDFLTPNQEKMMATQPDMILQFAHFLADHYQNQGIKNPEVRVESYVSLNGEPSRLFIDSTLDLTTIDDSFAHKKWILPFEKTEN